VIVVHKTNATETQRRDPDALWQLAASRGGLRQQGFQPSEPSAEVPHLLLELNDRVLLWATPADGLKHERGLTTIPLKTSHEGFLHLGSDGVSVYTSINSGPFAR
jgi:hypothetical protein